ncbi:hypothetical protein SteCoe_14186 [Stentor coeruleus]|uniref:EGF-like domain-containing protein n=1 Tax=Stentor coeruleus TaxID=5963 RepID=A0A1R2C6V8_9CILI|nr:hypothetical protein SteCoe_14186 [Stentor coeruleus]
MSKQSLSSFGTLIFISAFLILTASSSKADPTPNAYISTYALSSSSQKVQFIVELPLFLRMSRLESSSTPESLIDDVNFIQGTDESCNFLDDAFYITDDLFYIVSELSIGKEVIIELCQGLGSIRYGLILYNPSRHYMINIDSILSLFTNDYVDGFFADIYTVLLCPRSEFSYSTSSCKNTVRALSAITDFDDFVAEGNSIPDAINIFVWDTDYDLYVYMVSQLVAYETPGFESCNELITFASAIENLMSYNFFGYQTIAIIESLYGLTSKITCILLDYNEFPETYANYINIQALYLNYYTYVYDRASSEFANVAYYVDTQLRNFIIKATNGEKYTLYNSIDVTSSHDSLSGLARSIYLNYLKSTGADISGCTCTFCNEFNILSRIDIYYNNFFNDADSISTHIYEGGTVDLTIPLTTFTDQIILSVNDNCFSNTYTLNLYSSNAPNGYQCYNFNSDSLCSISSLESNQIVVLTTGLDFFWIKRICTNQCTLCSSDPLICTLCINGYFIDEYYYCSICHQTCYLCNSGTSCTSCIETLYPINPSPALCQCQDRYGFTDGTVVCSPCFSPYCSFCYADYSVCETCDDGYFENNNGCTECDKRCYSCDDGITCNSCKDNSYLLNAMCVCNDYFGFDANKNCMDCVDSNCNMCWNDNTYCDVCNIGFYEENGACPMCNLNCLDCDNSYSCTACKEFTVGPTTEGACPCQDGYGKDLTFYNCNLCSDLNCVLCGSNYQICTLCQDGYFLLDGACYLCEDTCETCLTYESCSTCKLNSHFVLNYCECDMTYGRNPIKSCSSCTEYCQYCTNDYSICDSCFDSYYLSDNLCPICHNTCATCKTTSTYCLTCHENTYITESNVCVCVNGYGLNSITGHCQTCSTNCLICTNDYNVCNQCDSLYGITTTYECAHCSNYCLDCAANSEICVLCDSQFYIDETYACSACMNTCKTCLNGYQCTLCWDNAYLDTNSQCICNDGYGLDATDGSCKLCSSNCLLCTANYHECTSCNQPYGLNHEYKICESCLEGCIECNSNSLLCTQCTNHYYLDTDFICKHCDNTCKECLTASTMCTMCWDYATLTDGVCTCDLRYGRTLDGKCQSCSSIYCTSCTNDYSVCTDCDNLYGLSATYDCGHCSDQCLACEANYQQCTLCETGYYINNYECSKCLGICYSCDYGNTCTVCGSYASGPVDGICTCYNYYGKNSLGACESCADFVCEVCAENKDVCNTCKSYASLVSNVCQCNNYYGLISNECTNCYDSLCLDCKSNYLTCNTCVEQAEFQGSSCTCVPHSTYSSTDKKCYCNTSFVLVGYYCEQGYLYIRSTDIVSGIFDSVFSTITITFAREFDNSVQSSCSSVLTDVSKLGTGIVCSFPSKYTFKIVLGLGWTITANDDLYINPTYLRRISGEYIVNSETLIVDIIYTSIPYNPAAIITGPSIVSVGCSSGTFEYSSSKSLGIASDSFSYLWISDVSTITSTTSTLTVSSTDIAALSTFTLYLTITDIFSQNSVAYMSIQVISTKVLTVSLDTGSSMTIKSSDSTNIQAKITDFCGEKGTPIYTWTCSQTVSSSLLSTTSSKLSLPSNTLPSSNTPYIFYVTASLNQITGSNSVSITVISSTIVILTNRPSGDVTSAEGFDIDASKSYDPDNSQSVLSFYWSVVPSSIIDTSVSQTSSTYSIPGNNLQGQSSFTLTLLVSISDRSSTITNTYTVIDNVNTVIKMIVPSTKVITSKQLLITTSITSTGNSIIKWSKLNGPDIIIKPDNYPYLSFMSNALVMGTTYTFQILVTESTGGILRSYSSITTNIGPECSVIVYNTPTTGIAKKTSIKFQIDSCKDMDGTDLPLWYTFGFTKGTSDTTLKQSIKDNYFSSIMPSGDSYPWAKVCDNLKDCITSRSTIKTTLNIRRIRRLASNESIIDEFKEDCNLYGVLTALAIFLDEENLDVETMEVMWDEFVKYVDEEDLNIELAEVVVEVIDKFLGIAKKMGLSLEHVREYIDFVVDVLDKKGEIENDLGNKIVDMASIVLDLGQSWDYVKAAHKLISLVFKLHEAPSTTGLTMHGNNVYISKTESFVSDILDKTFIIGSSEILITELDADSNSLVTIQAALYSTSHDSSHRKLKENDSDHDNQDSDTLFFSVFSDQFYYNYKVTDRPEAITYPLKSQLIIPASNLHNAKCYGINSQETHSLDCSVKDSDSISVTLLVSQSGFYSGQNGPKVQSSKVPLYIILTVLILATITAPILAQTEKSIPKPVAVDSSNITDSVSERSFKVGSMQLDTSMEILRPRKFEGHLLFNLSSTIPYFSRSKRYLLIVSVFVFEIVIENFLLMFKNVSSVVHPIAIGLISVCIALPFTILCCVLFSKRNRFLNILSLGILITMQILSVTGGVLLVFTEAWVEACVSGAMFELIIGQTLVMLGQRLFIS